MKKHKINVRIYYEDTDAAGVVYYANYLRFMERARTELLAEKGIQIHELHAAGSYFVVTHVDITYKKPALLGDLIEISTEVTGMRAASIVIRHEVLKDGVLITEASITLAFIQNNRPVRMPREIRERFERGNTPSM